MRDAFSENADRLSQHRAFIDAAASSGVQHIVYLSFVEAARDATFTVTRDRWATEQHIVASGISHTFLRDNFYTDFFAHLAGEDGVIRGAGRRRPGSQWQYDAWVSTYTAIAAGELELVSSDVERITGRLPESLRGFLLASREGLWIGDGVDR